MKTGITVDVLQIEVHDPGLQKTFTRFIHNVDGMRQVNYKPGPREIDILRLMRKMDDPKEFDQTRPINIVLTADGYLYATTMTPGYMDGDCTVTIDELAKAIPTTTTIY